MPLRIYQVTSVNQTLTVAAADHPTFILAHSQALRNSSRGSPDLPPFQDMPVQTLKFESDVGQILKWREGRATPGGVPQSLRVGRNKGRMVRGGDCQGLVDGSHLINPHWHLLLHASNGSRH